jgi:hypothetical protein
MSEKQRALEALAPERGAEQCFAEVRRRVHLGPNAKEE